MFKATLVLFLQNGCYFTVLCYRIYYMALCIPLWPYACLSVRKCTTVVNGQSYELQTSLQVLEVKGQTLRSKYPTDQSSL